VPVRTLTMCAVNAVILLRKSDVRLRICLRKESCGSAAAYP